MVRIQNAMRCDGGDKRREKTKKRCEDNDAMVTGIEKQARKRQTNDVAA